MGTRGWDTIGHGREMHGGRQETWTGDAWRQETAEFIFLFFYLLKNNDYTVGIQQTNGANVW